MELELLTNVVGGVTSSRVWLYPGMASLHIATPLPLRSSAAAPTAYDWALRARNPTGAVAAKSGYTRVTIVRGHLPRTERYMGLTKRLDGSSAVISPTLQCDWALCMRNLDMAGTTRLLIKNDDGGGTFQRRASSYIPESGGMGGPQVNTYATTNQAAAGYAAAAESLYGEFVLLDGYWSVAPTTNKLASLTYNLPHVS
jgi:hypothetical protein